MGMYAASEWLLGILIEGFRGKLGLVDIADAFLAHFDSTLRDR